MKSRVGRRGCHPDRRGVWWMLIITTCLSVSTAWSLDRNGDGLSDPWQALHGITAANADLDVDGDGFTNREEAWAGTDPWDRDSYLKSGLVWEPMPEAGYRFSWSWIDGKGYQIQTSTGLNTWAEATDQYLFSEEGYFYADQGEATRFFRLRVADSLDPDSDGDELLDWEETLITMTDPRRADSDGDLLIDSLEWEMGWNPLDADQDGNEISDRFDDFDQNEIPNFEQYLQETKVTDRPPTCTALIVDMSGSMSHEIRFEPFLEGVEAFVQCLDEEKDHLVVVTFSSFAKYVFPDRPDAQGFFLPSNQFQSGIDGDPNRSVTEIFNQRIRAAGPGVSHEGFRLAFLQVDEFLSRLSEEDRAEVVVNYVYLTDFTNPHAVRALVRGFGYGMQAGPDPLDPLAGATYDTGQIHALADLPPWHDDKPLAASKFVAAGEFRDVHGNDILTAEGENLRQLVGDREIVDPDGDPALSLPGINTVVAGLHLSTLGVDVYDGDTILRGADQDQRTLYLPASHADWHNKLRDAAGNPIPMDQPGSLTPDEILLIANECFKVLTHRRVAAYFPVSQPHSWNPGHPDQAFQEMEEYYPGGRVWANFQREALSESADSTAYLSQQTVPYWPQSGINGNFEGWGLTTARLSRYYPAYNLGGPTGWPGDVNGDGRITKRDADWGGLLAPVELFSYRSGEWLSLSGITGELVVLTEGDWMLEAQATVARVQHRGRIYAIGPGDLHARLANAQADGTPFIESQPVGYHWNVEFPYYYNSALLQAGLLITERLHTKAPQAPSP